MSFYVALLHKSDKKSSDYGVIFPDFPGAVFGGKTLEIALENARDGILIHIEGMLDAHEKIPNPTPLEEILKIPEYEEAIPSLIKVILPTGHLKRLNISMDAGLVVEVDHAAKLHGKNRSEFLSDAARSMLA